MHLGEPATDAAGDDALSVAQAAAALKVSEAKRALAELRPAAIRTAYAADIAKAKDDTPEDEGTARSLEAGRAAREVAHAEAVLSHAQLEREIADAVATDADDEKLAALREKLAKADERVTATRAAIEPPGEGYVSLRASRKAPEGPDESQESQQAAYPATSTGRRTSLAEWIVSRENPLTARVAVNHLWLRHFGQPLVETVTDFGRRAPRPVQQDLLDWLAVELMDSGWSMKHLHRLMVTSQAYRLTTSLADADPQTAAADPVNAYYWRRLPSRMQSEVVRDSLLQLAGVLDPTLGGPTIDPKQSHGVHRRSLYFTRSRDDQHAFLSMFDDADILACYRRAESIVPQQALTLANSELALDMTARIAAHLGERNDADEAFVTAAFELLLAKTPTEDEHAACIEFLSRATDQATAEEHETPTARARQHLVHVLVNHNDFVTIR